MRQVVIHALLAVALLASSCRSAQAVIADLPVRSFDTTTPRPPFDYAVRPFGTREGAPSQVIGIAQTSDGFLWLASSHRLVRFDGAHFVPEDTV